MDCESCQLKELVVEYFEIGEVLRCILHTIMFHRALGVVWPKGVDCQLFDITYVKCGDTELEKKVEETIDQFISWVDKHPNRKGQVSVSFYEIENKQLHWFGQPEHVYWEHWYVNLHVSVPKKRGRSHRSKAPVEPEENDSEDCSLRHDTMESSLREVMFQIIRFVNENFDRVPLPQNSDIIPFNYEITIPSASEPCFGWTDLCFFGWTTGNILKKILRILNFC